MLWWELGGGPFRWLLFAQEDKLKDWMEKEVFEVWKEKRPYKIIIWDWRRVSELGK